MKNFRRTPGKGTSRQRGTEYERIVIGVTGGPNPGKEERLSLRWEERGNLCPICRYDKQGLEKKGDLPQNFFGKPKKGQNDRPTTLTVDGRDEVEAYMGENNCLS